MVAAAAYLNGGAEEMQDRALVYRSGRPGASMMEQLVSKITTHALSLLGLSESMPAFNDQFVKCGRLRMMIMHGKRSITR
ncbi:hypothetical protein CK203_062673 [Vitis vinifera]|uniref:Uncharacterized protein n=1 Tax=Vitis vinifera TaxID=29760 RepID=A0A438FRU6_VITVI|nr:hypothetical protein CK203_062673 [Vitis vinifera]